MVEVLLCLLLLFLVVRNFQARLNLQYTIRKYNYQNSTNNINNKNNIYLLHTAGTSAMGGGLPVRNQSARSASPYGTRYSARLLVSFTVENPVSKVISGSS